MDLEQAHFNIYWMDFSNDDLADEEDPNPEPDQGWYMDVTLPDGTSLEIGPDTYGDGFATVEEALGFVEKWATDRGFSYSHPVIEVTVGKRI